MLLLYVPSSIYPMGTTTDSQGEQMRIIDGAKASKRRKGVAFFVRHFPVS
jgi:hypothetical protein